MEGQHSATSPPRHVSRLRPSFPALSVSTLLLGLVILLSLFHPAQCTATLDRRKESDSVGRLAAGSAFGGIPSEKRHAFSFPRAFDSSIGSNFTTESCPKFFETFLSDQKLADCIPISLMLQNSASFFDVTQSKTKLNKVLDAACSVALPVCDDVMASYANQILSSSTCLDDYNLKNPIVVQAYDGFVSYQSLYKSTCTKNQDRTNPATYNKFCFTNAVLNSSAPTNSYVYYLPLGVDLPSGAVPSCDWCLQKTMADFATYASNPSLPIAQTYPSAASSINIICGPSFVQAHIKFTSGASRTSTFLNSQTMIASLATLLAIFLSL